MSAGVRGFSTKPEIIHTKAVAARVRCTILRRNKNKQHSREDNIYETCKKKTQRCLDDILCRETPSGQMIATNNLTAWRHENVTGAGALACDMVIALLSGWTPPADAADPRVCAERTSVRLNLERTCSSTLYHIFASIKSLWDDGWMGWSQTMRAHRRAEHLRSVL